MIKEGIERFKAAGIPEKSIVQGASSGSTGEPFRYLTTKEDYSVNIAANLRGWYDMAGDWVIVYVAPESESEK